MNFIFFTGFSALLLFFLWLSVTFSKRFKKCVLVFSSIFNTKIQLCILEFVWSFIYHTQYSEKDRQNKACSKNTLYVVLLHFVISDVFKLLKKHVFRRCFQ